MAKKVQWLPNERVDVEDLDHGTAGYAESLHKELFTKFLTDNYPRVSDGFRVEIANQTTSAGQFTVYNGTGLDQDGTLITNAEDTDAQRSATITSTATYYVEVEFLETASDSALRGVWDPTYNNGLDASGDALPAGREYAQSVATRLTHDWTIVSPISTTGFALTSDPTSLRIPVAILAVSGGVITGATTSPARACLSESTLVAATKLILTSTSIMPDAFTATLDVGGAGQETVTVTSNDRANGILTLSIGTANVHLAGARLAVAGATPAQFLSERSLPTPVIATAAGDARPRFFQGNEEVGYALAQNPYASSGNADGQIDSLKGFVDFTSSMLREIKWGSGRASTIGNEAPPASFSAAPRYFDSSGGIMGARAHSVSVGDGAASWGDFNTTQSGSARAALQAAHDALPADGGIIFLKRGTYLITSTSVAFTKPVKLVGEGADITVITATGAVPSLTIASTEIAQAYAGFVVMEGLRFDVSGSTTSYVIEMTAGSRIHAMNCVFRGGVTATGTMSYSTFSNCLFYSSTLGAGICLNGVVTNSTFSNCFFQIDLSNAASRCVSLGGASTFNKFIGCDFTGGSTVATALVALSAASTNTHFTSCNFRGGTSVTAALAPATGASSVILTGCTTSTLAGMGAFVTSTDVRVTDCDVTTSAGGLSLDGSERIIIAGTRFTTLADQYAIRLNNGSSKAIVANCLFEQTTVSASVAGVGIDLDGTDGVLVDGCSFDNVDMGIKANDVDVLGIKGCRFEGTFETRGRAGLYATGTLENVVVSSCIFRFLGTPDETACGVYAEDASSLSVSDCSFYMIGGSDTAAAYGVFIENTSIAEQVSIVGCNIDLIYGQDASYGVAIELLQKGNISHNTIERVGSSVNVGEFGGILVRSCLDSVVVGNSLRSLGNASSAIANCAAIEIGTSGAGTSQTLNVTVSNNTIVSLSGALTNGVYIFAAGRGVVVSGNVFDVSSASVDSCIRVVATSSTFDLANILVSGNIMRGGDVGVKIALTDTVSLQEGRISVVNNQIYGYSTTGIQVNGLAAGVDLQLGFIVSNNLIEASADTEYGIIVADLSNFSIVGNNIYLASTAGNQYAIFCDSVVHGVVNSNVIRSNASSGSGIDTVTAEPVLVNGNYVTVDSSDPGISLGSSQYCVGNYVTQDGAGTAITNGDTITTITKALTNDDSPVNTLPDDTNTTTLASDIGLNRRVT